MSTFRTPQAPCLTESLSGDSLIELIQDTLIEEDFLV
jgi:hypothetical protein